MDVFSGRQIESSCWDAFQNFPVEGHCVFLVAFHWLLTSYHYSDTFPVVFNMVGRSYAPSHEAQKQMLQQQGVTVSNTIFILCSFAWIHLTSSCITNTCTTKAEKQCWRQISDKTLPIMMYTTAKLATIHGCNPSPTWIICVLDIGVLRCHTPWLPSSFHWSVNEQQGKEEGSPLHFLA